MICIIQCVIVILACEWVDLAVRAHLLTHNPEPDAFMVEVVSADELSYHVSNPKFTDTNGASIL